jgi:hypothetical protein
MTKARSFLISLPIAANRETCVDAFLQMNARMSHWILLTVMDKLSKKLKRKEQELLQIG